MRHSSIKTIVGLSLFAGGVVISFAADPVKGDAAKAVPIVERLCSGCHGQDGNSPVPNFPSLSGHYPEYLLHEMLEYKEHHRDNEMMSPVIQELSEEDMANLAVYFAAQKPTPATVTEPGLLALGKQIYHDGIADSGLPACEGCHGEDGYGSARFPRVAGQNSEYTQEQFRQYVNGKRKHGKMLMRVVAERITEQEVKAVAEYIASMP